MWKEERKKEKEHIRYKPFLIKSNTKRCYSRKQIKKIEIGSQEGNPIILADYGSQYSTDAFKSKIDESKRVTIYFENEENKEFDNYEQFLDEIVKDVVVSGVPNNNK